MPRPVRRSVRLAAPAYCAGLFFVTVCTEARVPLFGRVEAGHIRLSRLGRVAAAVWDGAACAQPGVVGVASVVMPDHVHVLFGIVDAAGGFGVARSGSGFARSSAGTACCAPTCGVGGRAGGLVAPRTVASVIRGYKSAVTRAARVETGLADLRVWQRGYHDRVVRSEREADAVRRYIADNPARWIPPPHAPRSPFP